MSQPPNDQTPEQPEQSVPEQHAPAEPSVPQPPQAPEAPEMPAAPQAPQFAPPAPQQPNYAPQPPHFAPPQQPAAPAQPAPQFAPPAQPGHAAPQAPQYGAPQQPAYGQPAQPAQPQYGQPAAPQYGQPGAPQYGAPAYAAQAQFPPAPVGTVPGPGGPFDGAYDPEDITRPLYGASFSQAIKRFFKQYANFNGRASRSEFWWIELFVTLVALIPLIIVIIGAIVMAASSSYDPNTFETTAPSGFGVFLMILGYGLLVLMMLALLVPSIAISWRRLHDGNFAGPMYFLSLIPYVGGIVLLVFMLLPSKAEGRRFDTETR